MATITQLSADVLAQPAPKRRGRPPKNAAAEKPAAVVESGKDVVFVGVVDSLELVSEKVPATIKVGDRIIQETRINPKTNEQEPVFVTTSALVIKYRGKRYDLAVSDQAEAYEKTLGIYNLGEDALKTGNVKLAQMQRDAWFVAIGGKVDNGQPRAPEQHKRTMDADAYILPDPSFYTGEDGKNNWKPTLYQPDNPLRFAHKPKDTTKPVAETKTTTVDPFAAIFNAK